jgi:hypothetical protein
LERKITIFLLKVSSLMFQVFFGAIPAILLYLFIRKKADKKDTVSHKRSALTKKSRAMG